MGRHYILRGHAAVPEPDVNAWYRWWRTADRVVARTLILGDGTVCPVRCVNDGRSKALVTTVFLGLAFGRDKTERPILFESLVFGGALDGELDRHATWEDAEAGHAALVARVRAALLSGQSEGGRP